MKALKELKLSKNDMELIKNNYETIIKLGLKSFKEKQRKPQDLTYTEQVIFDIINKYGWNSEISKEKIAHIYNKTMIKNKKSNRLTPVNVATKVYRINKKISKYKIVNIYQYGYTIMEK